MSYVQKTVSCKTIIAAIYQRMRPSNSSWRMEAIEDIGWAIQGIGYHTGFTKKSSEPPYLSVKNNRAKIPCEVERIIHVEQLVPHQGGDNILNPDGSTNYEYDSNCTYRGQRMKLGTDSTLGGITDRSPRTTGVQPNEPYYEVNDDYIITSFTEGLIKLHYVGFITDKYGLPKVIDTYEYKEAVIWWCIRNMLLKGYTNPNINFQMADAKWEEYRYKAENSVKGMTLDGAARFQASWMRAVTPIDINSDFYMNLEQPEFIDRG